MDSFDVSLSRAEGWDCESRGVNAHCYSINPLRRLERLFLGHLHGSHDKPSNSGRHVLTTLTQLHSASEPIFMPAETIVFPSYEHALEHILDRLLDFVSAACSEGEVI